MPKYIRRPRLDYITVKYIITIFFISRFFALRYSGKIYSRISICVSVYIFFRYIFDNVRTQYRTRAQIDITTIILLMFTLLQIVLTYERGGSIYAVIASMYPIIATTCFINLSIRRHPRELIKAYTIYVSAILIISFIDMFWFADNSLYEWGRIKTTNFFIGGINQFGIFFAAILGIQFLYLEIEKNYFSKILMLFSVSMIVLMSYTTRSSTTYVCVAVNLLLLFAPCIWKILVEIKGLFILSGYVVIWYLMIVARNLDIFRNIIINFLHRDITFSGRAEIWDVAIRNMTGNWLLGHGSLASSDVIHYGDKMWSLHNEVFQLIYEGGIILFGAFCFLFFVCTRSKKGVKRKENPRINSIIMSSILVILLNWLTESPGLYAMTFFLILYSQSDFLTLYSSIIKNSH